MSRMSSSFVPMALWSASHRAVRHSPHSHYTDRPRPGQGDPRGAGLLLLGAAICVAPWIVRQSLVHDRAVVNGGLGDAMFSRVRRYDPTFTLRDDGRPVAEADRATRDRIFELAPQYEYPREIQAILRQELGIGDVEADRLLRDVAWTVISQDPGRYVLGTLSMTGRLLRGSDPGLIDLWVSVERDRVLQGWPASLHWALETQHPRDDPTPSIGPAGCSPSTATTSGAARRSWRWRRWGRPGRSPRTGARARPWSRSSS